MPIGDNILSIFVLIMNFVFFYKTKVAEMKRNSFLQLLFVL